MRKICVITGTRAEYGLLSRLMRMIKDDKETLLQIVATNMHLSPKFGNTYQEIENDGFNIDYKIPIIDEDAPDTATTTVLSLSKALAGFAKAYEKLQPDLIVILGDRYEMLAATSAALIFKIPVAHLYGGEITEGAYDDAIRHAITKMSHLHFTATEAYRKRVIQMGEQPDHVFYVGAIGIENAKLVPLLSKKEIEQSLGFALDKNTLLATYHPVTNESKNDADVKKEIVNFFEALEERKDLRILFTMPNSDTGGQIIINQIQEFVKRNPERSIAFTSLGMKRYLSALQFVGGEAPAFHIPTLNIGDRQKGRISGDSVVHCSNTKEDILKGLQEITSPSMRTIAKTAVNPAEKEGTAQHIFEVIKNYPLRNITQKHFYDINP
jgi:UDP-N-acetylglucosamine 2-epimerase (non-hydrolysing)/GDP/UDP-N,N'-diacetylbacillosamine 2-epimerase (hydrolysing)